MVTTIIKGIVLSLYDYTGEAVRPWAEAGYNCICLDIQHPQGGRYELVGKGSISFVRADLHNSLTFRQITEFWKRSGEVVFMSAFPVCTDLAVSGARHFKAKADTDPDFQTKAAMYAKWCGDMGDAIGCPYFVENPVSRLATLWRAPDYRFDPCDFGGYIPEAEAEHPQWPKYIPPRDAYTKRTCLWTGGGFVMPEKKVVEPVKMTYTKADGYSTVGSPQWGKLGGKSIKTKNIRSATPRGFARAVFEANKGE